MNRWGEITIHRNTGDKILITEELQKVKVDSKWGTSMYDNGTHKLMSKVGMHKATVSSESFTVETAQGTDIDIEKQGNIAISTVAHTDVDIWTDDRISVTKKSGTSMNMNSLSEIHAHVEGGNAVELYKHAIKLKSNLGSVAAFEPNGDIKMIYPDTSTVDYDKKKGFRIATVQGDLGVFKKDEGVELSTEGNFLKFSKNNLMMETPEGIKYEWRAGGDVTIRTSNIHT